MNSRKFFTDEHDHEQGKAKHMWSNRTYEDREVVGAANPEWLQQYIAKNGPYLYHGTTANAAKSIREQGLYPHDHDFHGGNNVSTYDDYYRPRDGHAYLGTQSYVNSMGYPNGGLLRVDMRKLDPSKMSADEDHYLPQNANMMHPAVEGVYDQEPPPDEKKYRYESQYNQDADNAGTWANRIQLGDDPSETHYSMERGSMAYNGHIPPHAIEQISQDVGKVDPYHPERWMPEEPDWSEAQPYQENPWLQHAKPQLTFSHIAANADELHVGLDVPKYSAKAIYRWVRDQDWPEGTELEDPSDYHCSLLYSKTGSHWRHHPYWIDHLERGTAKVVGLDCFGPMDRGYAYVLRLESPEIQQAGQEMTDKGVAMGLDITHKEFKPHITVGYGPSEVHFDAPNFEMHLGPSSISEPRVQEEQPMEKQSLSSVGDTLHQHFTKGASVPELVKLAEGLMTRIGYAPNDMITEAAIQSWQMMYPQDQVKLAEWPSPFEDVIDQFGQFGLSVLYEEEPDRVEISHIEIPPNMRNQGIGSRFMAAANAYCQQRGKRLVVTNVDNVPFFSKQPYLQQQDTFGEKPQFVTAGNMALVVPPEDDSEPYPWETSNVDPVSHRDPKSFTEDERHHNDVQFSNDTGWQH